METSRPVQPAATIEAGLEALAQGAREEARSAFEDALRADCGYPSRARRVDSGG